MALITSITISAALAIILGVAVLFSPRILRWGLAVWLIFWGISQFV